MKLSFIMLLIWLLLSGGSQMLKAQNETIELVMKQNRDAWVCGDEDRDKKFIISLSMGEVKGVDSLYAMQVWLRYNPEKVMFVNLLDKNTLAEFFEIKGINVLDSGLFTAYAMTMGMNQATGNKPLIAFEVRYLKDCPDSVHINLDDIEFDISKSFWNRLNYKDKNLIVNIKTKETENSFVAVSFLNDTLKEFDEDSLGFITIGLNTNNMARVDSLDFEIKYKSNDNFELTDIGLFDAGLTKMSVDSIIRTEDGDTNRITIKSRLLSEIGNENVMKIKCKQVKKEDDTVRLDIKVSRINDCSCATSFKGDRMYVLSQKDTTKPIVIDDFENENNDIDSYYDFSVGDFVLKSKRETMKEVILFDMMGRMVEKIDIRGNSDYRISGQGYAEGIYIMIIKLHNGQEINKVLIKN
ncbi:T9SS C-terminal target domain-containing protein [Bacteroidetes/Chlorobi group bacterium ChocPot_Mid]|nr:MAG: T9SS C-terminal target domain-containing protein [Bacteroidetes/Chlorobi group bacterium ChocPot_Mid]